jgi:hypothetical protein
MNGCPAPPPITYPVIRVSLRNPDQVIGLIYLVTGELKAMPCRDLDNLPREAILEAVIAAVRQKARGPD